MIEMIEELTRRKAALVERSERTIRLAQTEQRDLTNEETQQLESALAEIERIEAQIKLAERVQEQRERLRAPQPRRATLADLGAQDSAEREELRAFAYWLRTGDHGAARELRTDAVITTDASAPPYGGYSIPTPLLPRVIAKRNEIALYGVLGVQRIPGVGTTVYVPVERGTAQKWAATAEGATSTREAPDLDRVPMTLVKYTKRIEITSEVLQDEDVRLLDWIADYVGRTLGMTHNEQLIAAVTASGAGTDVTLGAAAAATVSDVQKVAYALPGEYVDGAQFVMRRETYGLYVAAAASAYSQTPGPEPWPFPAPVRYSSYVEAVGANKISVIYANWAYVGMREDPDIFVLRDPYSEAKSGVLVLHHYARFCYASLNPEAIIRGKHPAPVA